MPVASMTGFARAEIAGEGQRLLWELRSVNGRSLDLKLRLPPGFDELDSELRRRAAVLIVRGSVQASLSLVRGDTGGGELAVNEPLLRRLALVADLLVREGLATPPSADGLLSLRGVIETREMVSAEPGGLTRGAALEAFSAALADLVAVRRAEGAAIASILRQRLDEIDALLVRAEGDVSRSPRMIVERLHRQVESLAGPQALLDPTRLHQEAALLAARADIAEELDRLRVHLAAARRLVEDGGTVGRRLDFLAQEFHRESNTICSKSNAASLTEIGLELKVVVDQFREQVQNIE